MVKLLIDTCSWRQLVSKIEISKKLLQIQSWVKNKEIDLLCPEILREEWQKHRDIELENVSKSLINHQKYLKLHKVPIGVSQQQIAKQALESQILIVDELFSLCTDLKVTDTAKIKTTDNRRSRKAPFRMKTGSDNDSLLIFSTLDYAKENQINEIYFLSDNHTDFAISTDKNFQIHPDIIEGYPGIAINYFKKPSELITTLIRNENLTSANKDVDLIHVEQGGLIIQKNLPIIDQLNDYIVKRYNEISFYPIKLLKDEFPFKVQSTFWPYYSLFTLYTDNEVLHNMFSSLVFSETEGITISNELYTNGVNDYKKKIEAIVKALNSNLIFYIGERDKNKKIEIRFNDKVRCDCIRCRYDRFDFQTVMHNLTPESVDGESDLIKKAYINYQSGNFLRAVEILEQVAKWAEENNRHTIYFFAKYNLSKLSNFLDNYYWGKNEQRQIVKRLREIDLEKVAITASTIENDRLIQLLLRGTFFSESLARVQELAKEIRDSYYLQVEGGFSSNSNVWDLINEFASLDQFLNNNFIVYDSFKEFTNLFEIFTEAVIASHAIPDSQGSKLTTFDDYLLKKLVYYGEPETIRKYTLRYNLSSIKYKSTSSPGETFLDICFNMMDGHNETLLQFESHSDNSHNFFWNKYNRIFSNVVMLFYLLDVDITIKNSFSHKLLRFLLADGNIKENNLFYVRLFLRSIKSDILYETKMGFVDMMLSNYKYHNEKSFELISDLIETNEEAGIPKGVFLRISELYFDEAVKVKGIIPSSIVYFFKKASNLQKVTIKKTIESKLKEKFDYELYYRAVMYDVIEHSDLFVEFFKKSIPKENSISWRNAFINKDERRFDSVNMLINLCFKVGIDLSQEVFDPIRAIDPYYKWLMNLNNFDYSKFNPFWVLEYDTSYYNSKFRQCSNLRKALISYLKNNRNRKLQSAYFSIYSSS